MASAPIDLRSDTVTRPTPGMRRAMAEAEVGDDVYGEDPTVGALEARVAERLGLEAALFVPSGTQGNQIAIGVHTRPGEEVILEEASHPFHYENGAMAALWGVQPRTVVGQRGLLTPAQIQAAFRGHDDHLPRSRLVILENTHNRGGGTVWKPEVFAAVVATARAAGLWSTSTAPGSSTPRSRPASRPAAGRVLPTRPPCASARGSARRSARCSPGARRSSPRPRRLRKRLGGGMRQAGILAAACLYALDHHVARLAEDHENARVLARRLAEIPRVRVELDRVETNMVYAETSRWTRAPGRARPARRGPAGELPSAPIASGWCATSTWTGPPASEQRTSCAPRWRPGRRCGAVGAAIRRLLAGRVRGAGGPGCQG